MFSRTAVRIQAAPAAQSRNGVRRVLVLLLSTVLMSGCLPDPHHAQAVQLLDQLVFARGMFNAQPPRPVDGCNAVGDVQTRLLGEPGLSTLEPAWTELFDAAEALQAVCGQSTLLAQPGTPSPAVEDARRRWERGIEREISVACDHLQRAAAALQRPMRC
jgi:hypothetical protein